MKRHWLALQLRLLRLLCGLLFRYADLLRLRYQRYYRDLD